MMQKAYYHRDTAGTRPHHWYIVYMDSSSCEQHTLDGWGVNLREVQHQQSITGLLSSSLLGHLGGLACHRSVPVYMYIILISRRVKLCILVQINHYWELTHTEDWWELIYKISRNLFGKSLPIYKTVQKIVAVVVSIEDSCTYCSFVWSVRGL